MVSKPSLHGTALDHIISLARRLYSTFRQILDRITSTLRHRTYRNTPSPKNPAELWENLFLDRMQTTGSETSESIAEQSSYPSCADISQRRPHKKEINMKDRALLVQKSILRAVPTATASQRALIIALTTPIFAHAPNNHPTQWLTGPRGAGKHFLFTACYRGFKEAGMFVVFLDCSKPNGKTKSYHALFQDLAQQLLEQGRLGIDPASPAATHLALLQPQGRTADELILIISEIFRAIALAPDTIQIYVGMPDTDADEAVRFITDLKSIVQEHSHILVSTLLTTESKEILESTPNALDPDEEILHLGLPSIDEYKNLARTFADVFGRVLNDATASLCAAHAMKLHAPPSYIHSLIAEAAKYTDFEIKAEHVGTALQALDFKPLEPLKDPITAVPILQAYASLYLAEQQSKKIPNRETIFVPISALRATYEFLTHDRDIPTLSPTEFEERVQDLVHRETASLNTKDNTLTLNPKFCYSTYLNHILSWDYRELFAQTPPSQGAQNQSQISITISSLYIGHLAALHAILSLDEESLSYYITSLQAYSIYCLACSDIGISPVKDHQFYTVIQALTNKKLIRTERRGRAVEIIPNINHHDYELVHNRFATLKEQAQTTPTPRSDEEIQALLPKAPAQCLALTAIHHLLRDTGKNQVHQSEVYPVYADLCRKNAVMPYQQKNFTKIIAALQKRGYIAVQSGRIGDKPTNIIKLC